MLFMDFIFFQFLILIKIMKWSLGFRVGKFRDSDLLDIFMAFFFRILILNENSNF